MQQPRSAYVHVPFCVRRCGYCNFSVVAGRDDLIHQYLEAIERELAWLEMPRPVDTLYLGGGTPTHLPPPELERLCQLVTHWFPLNEQHEFTCEANPNDITDEVVALLDDSGCNRLSLGAQSFHAGKLRSLERDHHENDIVAASNCARKRIANVSLDLIFAAPGESLAVWKDDLDRAMALSPTHVSTYGLTYEKGTTFWNRERRGELVEASEELQREMYLAGIKRLVRSGFEHYEVSNFARPGFRSRHNETYWTGKGFYGAGPGAARYIDGRREVNHRSTSAYLNRVLADRDPTAETEILDEENQARELLVFTLRRLDGLNRHDFQHHTGLDVESLFGGELDRFLSNGLLEWSDDNLRLTRDGLLVSDAIWPSLLRR